MARARSTKAQAPSSSREQDEVGRPGFFERLAGAAGAFSGSTPALIGAAAIVVLWAATGSLFGYSQTWQLVINTGTTIVTFLMVFLIQRSQNKESLAVQLKLNELVAAVQGASNRLVNVQDLTEDELRALHGHYAELARLAKQEADRGGTHTVEEAEERHRTKSQAALSARKKH